MSGVATTLGTMAAPGRRETKKLETRAALRDAAFALFAERGFAATRVADIAAACDVSERTFFRYFDSKEQVALAALQDWMEELYGAVEALPDSYAPIEAVVAVFRQADAGRFPFGPEQVRDVLAYDQFPEVRHHFTLVAEDLRLRLVDDFARRAGTDPLDPYPRVLASIISAGMFAVTESWLQGRRGDDPWVLARDSIARVANEFAASELGRSLDRTR